MLSQRTKQYNNSSGFRGVFKSGNKWIARISKNNERIYLGTFNTALEAHKEIEKYDSRND